MDAIRKIHEIQKNSAERFPELNRTHSNSAADIINRMTFSSQVPFSLNYDKFRRDAHAQTIDLINRGLISKYQNPKELILLYTCLEQLRKKSIYSNINEAIFIGSSVNGSINARAITSKTPIKSIFFESDLINWGFATSYYIAKFLEEVEVERNPGELVKRYDINIEKVKKENIKEYEEFLEYSVDTIIHGGTSNTYAESSFEIKCNSFKMHLIHTGFIMFSISHEYCHIKNSHHEKLRTGEKPELKYYDFWDTSIKYYDKYKKKYPNIDFIRTIRKKRWQLFEVEADILGHRHAISNYLHNIEDSIIFESHSSWEKQETINHQKSNIYLYNLGICSVFWSIDLIEKIIGTLSLGEDYIKNPLVTEDFDVQNIILRDRHPNPIYRLRQVLPFDEMIRVANNTLEPLYTQIWNDLEDKLVEAHKFGVRPHPRWLQTRSEAHKYFNLF